MKRITSRQTFVHLVCDAGVALLAGFKVTFIADSSDGLLLGFQEFSLFLFLCSQLIQKGTKLVLEQVVTSIASVADTAEEKFVPYYDLFMPSLKHIVENAVQKELRLLRGKTIECISLIGLAVGKEKVRLHRM